MNHNLTKEEVDLLLTVRRNPNLARCFFEMANQFQ